LRLFCPLNNNSLNNHTGLTYDSLMQVVPSGMERERGDIGEE
jgi:hypothetical protein